MSETSSILTKRNRKQYCTVKLIKYVRHVFQCLNRKIGGWQFEAIFAFPASGMLGGVVRLIQVGNNRNDHFRYFLGVRVRLIEVSA